VGDEAVSFPPAGQQGPVDGGVVVGVGGLASKQHLQGLPGNGRNNHDDLRVTERAENVRNRGRLPYTQISIDHIWSFSPKLSSSYFLLYRLGSYLH